MHTSGTAFVIFDNVYVPVENLIGSEGKGFEIIMFNFNHERLFMANQAVSLSRSCLEQCLLYVHKRKTFN